MARHEVIVVQMRISAIDAVDFGRLAVTEAFVFIEAPEAFQQAWRRSTS